MRWTNLSAPDKNGPVDVAFAGLWPDWPHPSRAPWLVLTQEPNWRLTSVLLRGIQVFRIVASSFALRKTLVDHSSSLKRKLYQSLRGPDLVHSDYRLCKSFRSYLLWPWLVLLCLEHSSQSRHIVCSSPAASAVLAEWVCKLLEWVPLETLAKSLTQRGGVGVVRGQCGMGSPAAAVFLWRGWHSGDQDKMRDVVSSFVNQLAATSSSWCHILHNVTVILNFSLEDLGAVFREECRSGNWVQL